MRVFLAGATGALGRALVPLLLDAGHQVVGTTSTVARLDELARAGAEPVLMDGLDARSVELAVGAAAPDVVIHQLTALSRTIDPRKWDQGFAVTNRLRTEGTDNLLAAARAAGAKRFVAQGFTGWTNPRDGGPVKDERDGLDPTPTAASRQSLAAIGHLEERVTREPGPTGIVLRYGNLYGPGTGLGTGGETVEMVRRRRLPLVGAGTGIWSFVHVHDAARATVRAVSHGAAGLYNVVDDSPAPVAEWLPFLASTLGARPPRRLPVWLARPVIGEHGVSLMTQTRGSSNAKAKAELGWRPRYADWREGFRTGLGRTA